MDEYKSLSTCEILLKIRSLLVNLKSADSEETAHQIKSDMYVFFTFLLGDGYGFPYTMISKNDIIYMYKLIGKNKEVIKAFKKFKKEAKSNYQKPDFSKNSKKNLGYTKKSIYDLTSKYIDEFDGEFKVLLKSTFENMKATHFFSKPLLPRAIGSTFNMDFEEGVYSESILKDDVESFSTFIHEMGHIAEYNYDQKSYISDYKNFADETIEIFIELVGYDFLIKNGENENIININFSNDLDSYLLKALKAVETDKFVKAGSDLVRYNKKWFLARMFLFEIDCISDLEFLNSDVFENNCKYAYSFLYAIELYYLFLHDKTKAENIILEYMKFIPNDYSEVFSFFKSREIYPVKSLKKVIKKYS